MKKLLLLLLFVPLIFSCVEKKKEEKDTVKNQNNDNINRDIQEKTNDVKNENDINISEMEGVWVGTYTGDEKGVWNAYFSNDGSASGTATSKYNITSRGEGNINKKGELILAFGTVNSGAEFKGEYKNGRFIGTWQNDNYNMSGTFISERRNNNRTVIKDHETTTTVVNNAGSEWDEFLDNYEDYVDKSLSLMKKMKDDPTNMSVMTDYINLAQDALKWTDKMDDAMSADDFTSEHLERMMAIQVKLANAAY